MNAMTTQSLPQEFGSRKESARGRIGFGLAISIFLAAGLVLMVAVTAPMLGTMGEVSYEITATSLSIMPGSVFSWSPKVINLSDITRSQRAVPQGGIREMGAGMPGYCVGRFRYPNLGSVWQATNCSTNALLIEARGEPLPILLTPPDPTAFESALRAKQPMHVIAGQADMTIMFLPIGIGAVVMVLGLGLILSLTFLAPTKIRYRVEPGRFEVRTMFLRKSWPTVGMRARLHHPKMGRKLFGTGMPGYRTGWFKVDDERTLVYATAREGVLIEGPARVFVTPDEPRVFLDALRQAGARIEG